eukprot:m.5773 g.5773  ORF g.5773 m.5773 type:complete len:324 (-) comp5086_c0_seq1:403-1374(-)
MAEPTDIVVWADKILRTGDAEEKVRLSQRAAELWYADKLTWTGYAQTGVDEEQAQALDEQLARVIPPATPPRPEDQQVISPHLMKIGKGGTLQSRIAILHSLANIEQWAMDLAWDIIARFGGAYRKYGAEKSQELPKEFYTDFVRVAEDECRHYTSLATRLVELGSRFGDLPVHHGLWQSATETSHNLMARLAIVHMVHEARGLDVTPNTIEKFARNKDSKSAEMLQVIYQEEISHVTAGMKWFRYLSSLGESEQEVDATRGQLQSQAQSEIKDDAGEEQRAVALFHQMVRKHFHGLLKPPFNTVAREQAGFTEDWYMPLTIE